MTKAGPRRYMPGARLLIFFFSVLLCGQVRIQLLAPILGVGQKANRLFCRLEQFNVRPIALLKI